MGKLVVLMITAFVDMVGVLMVLPLLPFYAVEFGGKGLVVGFLVSSFAIAQLLAAPIWGRVSDRYGRRPALIAGLSASAIAYVIFAFAHNFAYPMAALFISRLVQGAGGGTVSVIQAYVADATKPEQRARSLGWLSAATNAGVAIGPVIGSWSLSLGRPAPGLFAATLCTLNIMFAWRYLSESHDTSARGGVRVGTSREAVWRVLRHTSEPSSRLIWMYAIGMGAFQGMNAVLALFLAHRYGVNAKTIGYFFMYVGVISIITRAAILGPAVDRMGEPKLSRLGLLLLGIGLTAIPFTYTYPALALAVALVPLGTAFTFPCVTAMLSRVISGHERGLYMGVQQTFGGAARVLAPIWAGFAFDHLGVGVPFWTSAALVFCTIFLGLGMEQVLNPRPVPAIVVEPAAD